MNTWRTTASRVLIGFAVVFGLVAVLLVAAMLLVRTEWAERRIEGIATERIGREVDLEGLQILAAWPPQVELQSLRIANPGWAHEDYLVDARGMRATFEAGPLFRGRVVTTVALDDAAIGLEKQEDKTTWALGPQGEQPAEDDGGEGGTRFAVRSVSLGEARVSYRDEPDSTEVMVRASGDLGREGRPFQAQAEGQFRGEPLNAKAQAPAVPLAGDQPVKVSFEGGLGENRAWGTFLLRSYTEALQSLDATVEVSGKSFASLNKVAGLKLPRSAPYWASAHLQHEGGVWKVNDFKSTLGKSDMHGWAALEPRKERPFLRAEMRSNLFDLNETGIKPAVQKKLKEKFLIPREPWKTDGLDAVDAEVYLKIDKVRNARPVPLDALEMRALLENSELRIDPVNIALAGGTVTGRIALNAAESPEEVKTFIQMKGLRLSRLFPKVKQGETALGRLNGRIELSGRGASPHEYFAGANGRILFAAERGTASGLLVEVLGLDVAEAAMLVGKRKTPLPLRCAVVDLNVKKGNANVSTFVIDASDSVLSVEGGLNLGKESLDLTARAEPRDASAFSLRTPANITGTFLDPKVRPHAGPLAGRAAAAIALGAINPLLALIPFVDPGGDPEGGCQPQKR